MEQHHGFVLAESAPGAGTTMRLYFPRTENADAVRSPK